MLGEPKMNKPNLPSLALLAVMAIVLTISWQGLSGPLVFDDLPNLSPNFYETPPNYREFILDNDSGLFGRSVSMATFALNHRFRGDFTSFDLKATNLGIHIANGLLLYCILLVLLRIPFGAKEYRWIAVLVASAWLLSPINLGVTFYAIQRMALLSSLFMFAGILCYVRCRALDIRCTAKTFYFLACLVCWPLACLSKENGILLPVLILVIELEFFAQERRLNALRIILLSLFAGGCVGIFFLQGHDLLSYAGRSFSMLDRLSTQPVVLSHYIRDLLLPVNSDVGLFNDDFPVQRTPWSLATLVTSTGLISSLIFCFRIVGNPRVRAVQAGILFFFVGHSLESTVFPLEMYFEHRNYLPSAGLYLAAIVVARAGVMRYRNHHVIGVPIALLALTLFASMSYFKAKAWSTEPTLVANLYQHHPASARAGLEMASMLLKLNDLQAALRVNAVNAAANPGQHLNITLQRFYLHCEGGKAVDDREYNALTGLIYPGNELATATAFELLAEIQSGTACQNVDFNRLADRVVAIVDTSLGEGLVTARQAWHVEFYIIEMARADGRLEFVRQRLNRSANAGNEKAVLYSRNVLHEDIASRQGRLERRK